MPSSIVFRFSGPGEGGSGYQKKRTEGMGELCGDSFRATAHFGPEPRAMLHSCAIKSPPALLKMMQSAEGGKGTDKRERIIVVVRSPCQENNPADAHTNVHKSVLESANPAWTQSLHLDAPGQRHGQQPVSGTAGPGVVKQDKSSRGSVDTTMFGPT